MKASIGPSEKLLCSLSVKNNDNIQICLAIGQIRVGFIFFYKRSPWVIEKSFVRENTHCMYGNDHFMAGL